MDALAGKEFGPIEPIDYSDPKIAYVVERCRGRRVLDLGCVMHEPDAYRSRYFVHRAIVERAREVIGLDTHASGVRTLCSMGYRVEIGNAESFRYDEPFEVIVAGDIVEHLANLHGFLESCRGSLAPDGMVIVQSPNPWYWKNVVKSVLYTEVPNNFEHTCWFCPRTWRQLVERHGFTIRNIEFQSRHWRDRLMPLPRGVRETSWSLETVVG